MARVKPYDAAMRSLADLEPAAWPLFLGVPVRHPERVVLKNANISTVAAEVDGVLWMGDEDPWIFHLEFQAARDLGLPDRLHWYSTLLGWEYKVPVRSTVALLRPASDGPDLTGLYEQEDRQGVVYGAFHYNVVRIWERPVEEMLAASLSILPLAPVSAGAPERLSDVLTTMARRFRDETTPEGAERLLSTTEILMGLCYSDDLIKPMMKEISAMILGIRGIEESTVYQRIFAEGEAEGEARGEVKGLVRATRSNLLSAGCRRFGPPNPEIEDRILALDDPDRLHELFDRVFDVASWEELFPPSDTRA